MALSVIIPAYNEETRIQPFLSELVAFKRRAAYPVELIVVDDGSKDKTVDVVKKLGKDVVLLRHEKNRGKGAAIRTGYAAAKNAGVVFMDADGSTPARELDKMEAALQANPVVVASRKEPGTRIVVSQPLRRILLGKAFNFLVNLLFPIGFYDALCGFKGLSRPLARELANELVSDGWIFDVEWLYRLKRKGYQLKTIPIEWGHVEGSKMRLGLNNLRMLSDLVELRLKI
ncbi:MAG: glycosyltransferase family 2 protein [Candidatus Diapherotrites archaeon]|uniref:dolichyl-phosphate beta-glucosyltransferase n=1 Tax=Candidatus Iainarchaeum sp. TaxID=3101447 RepID=A0A8T4LGK3_9ARCH|nr:glycosyltransferase family 2 protein [Candidatus Diapherotrites archaeon]